MGGPHVIPLDVLSLPEEEVLRYAMVPPGTAGREMLPLRECVDAVLKSARCRGVWRRYPIRAVAGEMDLGFARTASLSLKKHLEGCHAILLTACTAGFETDVAISRAAAVSPLHGLLIHAAGTALAEAAADLMSRLLKDENPGETLTSRFSPGYGDLPLTLQREIFPALQCEKTIGITLSESCLMKPSKSVTAVIGLKMKGPEK